ncbi:hypothetical protein EDB19DRAFT_1954611 [Suillus lakei]|nr:hypothetical protein EDB19DRAFT_1954611 [Suillus lakei]
MTTSSFELSEALEIVDWGMRTYGSYGKSGMIKERFSIPYFMSADSDILIDCLPGCWVEENPKKYEPVTATISPPAFKIDPLMHRTPSGCTTPSSPDHSLRSSSLNNIALSLRDRFTQRAIPSDLDEAFCLFLQFLHISHAVSRNDLTAAKSWASSGEKTNYGSALVAYQTALKSLDQHVTLLSSSSRHFDVVSMVTASLAADAFSCSIRHGALTTAVELVEQGRTVFWNHFACFRTPIDEFCMARHTGAALAEEFKQLNFRLRNAFDQSPQISQLNMQSSLGRSFIDASTAVKRSSSPESVNAGLLDALDGLDGMALIQAPNFEFAPNAIPALFTYDAPAGLPKGPSLMRLATFFPERPRSKREKRKRTVTDAGVEGNKVESFNRQKSMDRGDHLSRSHRGIARDQWASSRELKKLRSPGRSGPLDAEIASSTEDLDELQIKTGVIEAAIHVLEKKILEIGGSKLLKQMYTVDVLRLLHQLANEEVTEAEAMKATAERNVYLEGLKEKVEAAQTAQESSKDDHDSLNPIFPLQ